MTFLSASKPFSWEHAGSGEQGRAVGCQRTPRGPDPEEARRGRGKRRRACGWMEEGLEWGRWLAVLPWAQQGAGCSERVPICLTPKQGLGSKAQRGPLGFPGSPPAWPQIQACPPSRPVLCCNWNFHLWAKALSFHTNVRKDEERAERSKGTVPGLHTGPPTQSRF